MGEGGRYGNSGSGFVLGRLGAPQTIQQVMNATRKAQYEQNVNQALEQLLHDLNDRDIDAVNTHLDEIKKALSSEIGQIISLLFGGSVAKHTYSEGLSDVDVIAVINKTDLEGKLPRDILAYFHEQVAGRFPKSEVITGAMTVTVKFSDGTEVQVVPAIHVGNVLRLPIPGQNKWGGPSFPERFAGALTEANRALGGKLVRVIKLFKLAQESVPERSRLSGYHIEALAMSAFAARQDDLSLRSLLTTMVNHVSTHLDSPIVDPTNQSNHVDDYLGPANSSARIRASRDFARMAHRLQAADHDSDKGTWEDILGQQ